MIQLAVQYRLNVWNRDLFNAIEKKDGQGILSQAMVFLPLAMATVGLAVIAVFGRMKMQREWRAWVTDRIVGRWLTHGHYYQLNLSTGEPYVPESRITDDTRIATDVPIDFALGIFQSVITAITFIGVLWFVGGSLQVSVAEYSVNIPGYVVLTAILYSAVNCIRSAVTTQARHRRHGRDDFRARPCKPGTAHEACSGASAGRGNRQ